MKWYLYVLPTLIFAAAGCTSFSPEAPVPAGPARPVRLEPVKAEEVIREIERDRAETEDWLRSDPMSYLAAVDRVAFGRKQSLTVGRAADNDVVLSAGSVEPHHLRISVDGDRFLVEAVDPKAEFGVEEGSVREAIVEPSAIQVGRFRLRLSHQHFPAIIVFDPESPRFSEYKGIAYFPVDLSYRFEVPLKPNRRPEKIIIQSTRGDQRSAERVGWVEFLVGDTPCRLEATRLLEPGIDENEASIFFRDATTGRETYSVGRYVDLTELGNGNYLLDFNLAYNPACAFSSYYNCPIPPESNTLEVAIRAGEIDAHYHPDSDGGETHP